MNWNTKAAWIYKETMPNLNTAGKYGIKTIYADPTSTNVIEVFNFLRANNILPGAYFSDSWAVNGETGTQFANWVSDMLNKVLPRGTLPEANPCMLDIERQDRKWAIECIKHYRTHQPSRPTGYTNAPFQGGYVPTSDLRTCNMHLYVQLYYGDMSPADPSAALLEQIRQGMPSVMVHPFYDGARYTNDSRDGCYFTLERLP